MSGKTVENVLDAVAGAAADVGGAVLHAVGLTTDGAEVLADEAGQAVGAAGEPEAAPAADGTGSAAQAP